MENLNLYPWVISLDKEKTIEYYINNDLSEDKSLNLALKKQLDSETLNFIERFGVDIKKARVCFIPSIFDEDDVGILSKDFYKLGFMFAGQLDAVPSVQWDFYFDRLVIMTGSINALRKNKPIQANNIPRFILSRPAKNN